MHAEAREFVARAIEGKAFPSVVEVGSRYINGGVRDLFGAPGKADPDRRGHGRGVEYLGVDVVDGPGVDLVADAAVLRVPRKAHAVVCCEVLEHTPDAQAIVENMLAMVRKGGLVVVTAACDPRAPHSAVDGGPLRDGEFYANVEPADLERWLSPCAEVAVAAHARGDVYARAVR